MAAPLQKRTSATVAPCRDLPRPVATSLQSDIFSRKSALRIQIGDKQPISDSRATYNDSVWSITSERHIGDILRERNIEIIGADLATRHGFTQVPNFILTKEDISVGAKLAYAMLLKYAWSNDACFPGQVTLAKDMGAADRSVRTYLKELETAELLEIKQRGLGKTNLYRLHLTVKPKRATVADPDRQILPVWSGNGSPFLTGNIFRSLYRRIRI